MDYSKYSVEAELAMISHFNEFSKIVHRDDHDAVVNWLKTSNEKELNSHAMGCVGYMYACLKKGNLTKFHTLGVLAAHHNLAEILEHVFSFGLYQERVSHE